jgi:hypothetical protein
MKTKNNTKNNEIIASLMSLFLQLETAELAGRKAASLLGTTRNHLKGKIEARDKAEEKSFGPHMGPAFAVLAMTADQGVKVKQEELFCAGFRFQAAMRVWQEALAALAGELEGIIPALAVSEIEPGSLCLAILSCQILLKESQVGFANTVGRYEAEISQEEKKAHKQLADSVVAQLERLDYSCAGRKTSSFALLGSHVLPGAVDN